MSDVLEQQAEELKALESIYEGDNFFKQLNPTTVSYQVRLNIFSINTFYSWFFIILVW